MIYSPAYRWPPSERPTINDSDPWKPDVSEAEERWDRIRGRIREPRLRWNQFSLRALLVFVPLLIVPLGWLAGKMLRARRQWEAVQAIQRAGGHVQHDTQKTLLATPPARLQRSLGDDFFYDVFYVDVGQHVDLSTMQFLPAEARPQITDDGLRHVAVFTNLRILNLQGTQVSDARLEHIEGLTRLEVLYLGGTPITDAGLEHLKGLTSLEMLSLWRTQVADEGVEKLHEALPFCRIEH